jgi:site-specific DNA-methyltransferase (adenine-specific)
MKPIVLKLSDNVTIINGDCRDVLPVECDLICCDPPYGMAHPCNFAGRGRGNLAKCNDWSDVAGDAEPFDPAWILAMNKPTVLWGGNWFADKLPPSSGWLVWDKERPDELDQATCELAWTNCVKGVRRFRHLWNGMMKASEKGESYHPTQKPVALFAWVLALRWLTDAQTVFDPYMGAGPCGVACVRAGKRYVGVEIDPVHFETARDRLTRELEQGRFNFSTTEPAPAIRQADML